MDKSYWQEIVAKLHQRNRCEWAAHVLASDLDPAKGEATNLTDAIQATSPEEVIEGVLNAYQDWAAQPACDRILRHFGDGIVPAAMRSLGSDDPDIRRGALGALYDVSPAIAKDAARTLEARESNDAVRQSIQWVLNEEHS